DTVGRTVGAPGEAEAQAIHADAVRFGVADRVRLVGPIALARLLALYRTYDVFVLPTLPGEGIPRVLLEAMTGGVPIVTTAVAGIPSLVEHERNGLLVDAISTGSVSAAIERLIFDGALRRRLIANGYTTASAHTLEAQADRMMRVAAARLGIALRAEAPVPVA